MDSLIPYLIADILLLMAIGIFMARNLTLWHPLTAYLFFHAYSFSWRVMQLIMGAVPMYGNRINLETIRPSEFERAIVLADFAIICFTIGSFLAHQHFRWSSQYPRVRRVAKPSIINAISAFCIPAGILVLIIFKTGVEINATLASSNYLSLMSIWPMSCLLALVIVKGFRPIIVIPICAYLVIVGLQGYHRFMAILPMLCLAAIYLQKNEKKWPTFKMMVIGFCMMAIFPSLKHIGRAVTVGDYSDAFRVAAKAFYPVSDQNLGAEKEFTSEEFLDQYAGALTMIDDNEKVYRGSTYLAIVTLPIPRQLWPGKPGLADFMYDISTASRPYSTEGRIMTYIGESYLNFRYFGVCLIPLSIGFGLTYWCLVATSGPWLRINRYIYAISFMALILLFRDGLLSLLLFSVIHNLPTLFIWVAHIFSGGKLLVEDPPSDRVQPRG